MVRSFVLAVGLLAASSAGGFAGAEEWVSLFNGQDLEGWTPKIKGFPLGENFGDTFRVEDGVLKVRYDQYTGPFKGRFGHLFYKEPLSHYRLRLEYRVVGEQAEAGPEWANRNSGVMIFGQDPATMALDQDFPVSIEVQLLGGKGDGQPRSTANVCTPGTHFHQAGKLITAHCNSSTSPTFKDEEWVQLELEVHGAEKIIHRINGEVVFEYEAPVLDEKDASAQKLIASGAAKELTGGTISLQAESHPVEFRKIELLKLAE